MGGKISICVSLSDDTIKRLNAIKPIVNVFAGLRFERDDEYIEFLLNLAIFKILNDVLPDADSRLDLIKMIFRENPEIVVKHIVKLLEESEVEKVERRPSREQAPMHT